MEEKTEPQKRSIPAKALYFTDMRFITNGPAAPSTESSANEVRRVNFTTADGRELLGFYKPLSDIYPELLAKYCVAISVAGRMCLGDAVSDERLVFDKGKIVGTVSIAIPGFGDPSRKLATELSTDEILNTNIIEILVWMMFVQNDDFHPNNISRVDVGNAERRGKAAVFDFDLCLRGAGLSAIKTPRYAELVKQLFSGVGRDQDFSLKAEHLIQFPNSYDATYWPSREYPGNLNINKAWANQDAFAKLNAKPYASRTFDLMYGAILKIFMLSDRPVLKARLIEAFGDTLLDFLEAPNRINTDKANCAARLMEKAPILFTTATDRAPFYEHFLNMYTQLLDHWQNVVVSFRDPREPSELWVNTPRFCDFLSQNHSARAEIMAFIEQENQSLIQADMQSAEYNKPAPLGTKQFGEQAKLSPYLAEQRFLLSWWFSHTEQRKAISDQVIKLVTLIDANITYSLDGSTTSHHTEPTNPLVEAKQKLLAFQKRVRELEEICENSLKQRLPPSARNKASEGSDKDAITQFCEDLLEERSRLFRSLSLGNGNQYKAEEAHLNTLALEVAALLREPTAAITRRVSETKPLNDNEKKERLFREFLAWLRKTESDASKSHLGSETDSKSFFVAHITEALKCYKEKASQQERCKKIEKFVKSTPIAGFSAVDSLAFIMSHGGTDSNSLNTFLFYSLIRQFVDNNIATHNYSVSTLMPSKGIIQTDNHLRERYLPFFQEQFQKSQEFNHYFCAKNRADFVRTLKGFLAKMTASEFNSILERVLQEYKSQTGTVTQTFRSVFSLVSTKIVSPLRETEIKKIQKENAMSSSQKMATIWRKGGWENNSYNTLLFKMVLNSMLLSSAKYSVDKSVENLIKWLLNEGIEFLTDFVSLLPLNKLNTEDEPLSISYSPSESSFSN